MCNPGYTGSDCSLNLCEQARCGPHGTCVITYLGSGLTSSRASCQCKDGYSGPNCDTYVCANQTCSGHGKCVSSNDGTMNWQCVCDAGYNGATCQRSCVNACPGNNGGPPYGCEAPTTGMPDKARYCGSTIFPAVFSFD
jgi:hypothetical protein